MWMSLDLEPEGAPRSSPQSVFARAQRRLRILAPLLALSVALLACGQAPHAARMIAAPPPPAALTPEAIAEYGAKLEKARATRSDLEKRVTCLNGQDAALVAQRDEKQRLLGEARTRETELSGKIREYNAAFDGFRQTYDSEGSHLDGLRRELWELEARKRAQEADLQDCKSRWWAPNFMCDLANEIAHLFGLFKNVQGDIDATQRRVDTAREGMDAAWRNLDQSRQALTQAQTDATSNADLIRRHETDIRSIQSVLSELRPSVQSFQVLTDGLRDALDEASKVDTEDGRARTARKVQGIAGDIDAALEQSGQAMTRARSVLPEDVTRSCVAA
jgi:predicted  nucleic acid-binding Zn-ribbon protein